MGGVSEGIRTPGRWSHNPELYQLSYAHHTYCETAQNQLRARPVACSQARNRRES